MPTAAPSTSGSPALTSHAARPLYAGCAAAALAGSVLSLVSIFTAYTTNGFSLHQSYGDIFHAVVLAVIPAFVGALLLTFPAPKVAAAVSLLLIGATLGYVGTFATDLLLVLRGHAGAVGFWVGLAGWIVLLVASALAGLVAARSRQLRTTHRLGATEPALVVAVGLIVVLYLVALALPIQTVEDHGELIEVSPGAIDLGLEWAFGAWFQGVGLILTAGALAVLVPAQVGAFLLLGWFANDVAILLTWPWGFSAELGGTVAPGSGTILREIATICAVAAALILILRPSTTTKNESHAAPDASEPPDRRGTDFAGAPR